MTKKLLLTGRPGCGKTTLMKRIVKQVVLPADGFYTEEIRKGRERVGFKIVTLDGQEALLAHVDFKTNHRVGKYGLHVSGLETIGIPVLRSAIDARRLLVLDEIGPMEIRSAIFRRVVEEALDSGIPILATISARPLPFTNAIKNRPDVTVIEVRPDNREQLVSELSNQFIA